MGIILIIFISGCGVKTTYPNSPKEVYLEYIEAAQKADYIKVEQMLSSSTREQLMSLATATGKTFDVALEAKIKMDLGTWEIAEQSEIYDEIDGNRAKVYIKSKPDEAPGFNGYYSLFNEDGKWKLEIFHMKVEP